MRYLVKARVKSARERDLVRTINDGTLGKGSIAGDEYLYDMEQARVKIRVSPPGLKRAFAIHRSRRNVSIGKSISSCSALRTPIPAARAGTKTEHNHGPVATVIALRSLKSGSRRKANRFSRN